MSSVGTKFVLAGRFVFDPNNNSLVDRSNGNELSRLGSNESRILLLFSQRPNQVISRDELHEFVWRDQGFQVDDSSLTQAISTLRKTLFDSTKAPKYIKTVPKRGYQFIESVERTVPLSSGNAEPETDMISEVVSVATSQTANNASEVNSVAGPAPESAASEISVSEQSTGRKNRLYNRLLLIAAALLPVFVFVAGEPAPSKFRLIDTIDGVPLKTTESHPPLGEWQPLVHQCVSAYLTGHSQKPVEIIATAGPNNNLMLNYVHSELNTSENVTIQLIAKQQDMSELCKYKGSKLNEQ